ncbi:MAG: hypothetical protein HYX87_04605 [Chloroflexi bacterium]|nr:hypothetical protein [Chloroflexota bacterium]
MVQNTGKASSPDTIRPVNIPELVRVEEDSRGFPVRLRSKGLQAVAIIADKWRIDDEWWRTEMVSRLYFAIVLKSGQRLVVYKDLTNGCWYRQSY